MTGSATDSELVKVAYANDEAEAELIQGLLRLSDVESVVRRAPGFDVPEFLAAGPREVLVAASDVPVARDVLLEVEAEDSDEPEPSSRSSSGRPSPLVVGLLLAAVLVTLVVCVAADVFP